MDENNQEESASGVNQWLQDNLRIIISIIIVIAIAGGIYSYSKRSQEAVLSENESADEISLDSSTLSDDESAATVDESEKTETPTETEGTETAIGKTETTTPEQVTPTATSKETEGSFIETAGKGDGTTHLARRALANYLEKSPDSELKAEQKIYIEDYMRKKVGSQRLSIGTSVEFSKDLIKEAIGASKELNDVQIKNLHKYVVLVPSLS